jgi:hypothetical protein
MRVSLYKIINSTNNIPYLECIVYNKHFFTTIECLNYVKSITCNALGVCYILCINEKDILFHVSGEFPSSDGKGDDQHQKQTIG